MTPRQTRMAFVGVVLAGVALAAALVISAIGENMLYFFSPSQVKAGQAPTGRTLRVGGLVSPGSVSRGGDGNLTVSFDLTDQAQTIPVRYTGILPDLFREGQGIVAMGSLDANGVFQADEVLAKHDEKYMPPEVAEALKMAAEGGQMPNPHESPPK
jgi:cytochrome c-type biogenesis protein CcmE